MLDIKKLREKNLHFSYTKGKVVADINCDFYDDMVLTFSDGTFTVIHAHVDSDCEVSFEHEYDPDLSLLERSGIITREDLDCHAEDEAAKRKEEEERREKVLLQLLKAKYEK